MVIKNKSNYEDKNIWPNYGPWSFVDVFNVKIIASFEEFLRWRRLEEFGYNNKTYFQLNIATLLWPHLTPAYSSFPFRILIFMYNHFNPVLRCRIILVFKLLTQSNPFCIIYIYIYISEWINLEVFTVILKFSVVGCKHSNKA